MVEKVADGVTRTTFHRADLEGAPGMEVISSLLEVQPGKTLPRHFHNGIEAARVVDGAMIQFPGKEAQKMEAGTPVFYTRGVYHAGFKVLSDTPLRIYTVHVLDKGKPIFDGVDLSE